VEASPPCSVDAARCCGPGCSPAPPTPAHQAGERSLERRYAEADQDQRIADLETRGVAPATAPPAESGLVGELTKLKGLLDAGALTPDEFEAAKRKLLST
jgi:hypothetical protein